MQIDVLTIFPELFAPFLSTSLVGKAVSKGLLAVEVHDLRQYTLDRHRSVDDEPYGGGGGMVMTAQPWIHAVREITATAATGSDASRRRLPRAPRAPRCILMSPQGRRLDEATVRRLADLGDLLLLCGRYEGIDERVLETVVDEEISIGDFVVSGGELPAMVLIEAMSRQVPGVVGLADSVENDSFRAGILDHPHYTRPASFEDLAVPEVLTSGDHAAIERWRRRQALAATLRKRPELLESAELTAQDRRWLDELRREEPER